MTWNAAIVFTYRKPIPGREAKALENFADGITTFGKLAADGKCAEPEVFHHLIGGGIMVIKTETPATALEIMALDHVRTLLDACLFNVVDFDVRVMVTGELLMENMGHFTAVGTELGYL